MAKDQSGNEWVVDVPTPDQHWDWLVDPEA